MSMKQRQKNRNQYDFGYSRLSGKDSGSSDEETELFERNKSPHKEIPTIEKVVEEGDTLQALSIRYACTIADLKRINNIHKENEIFAKRTIKVPHRPFTMALAGVHISGNTSPSEKSTPEKKIDTDVLNSKLNVTLLNLPDTCSSNGTNFNEVIFNSNITTKICDNEVEKIAEDVNDEEINLLPHIEPIPEVPVVVSRLSCSGADADISWITLIICIVVVIFAVPLIYVFYIAEHPETYHQPS